ncbi:16S rRNA (guanine(966)-N(2))-methyltransferase RsmD [Balneolaceae bacterium YR4-1]|uniref:16S rRNA (Guanine(966)-N(2))-methyltransferase RsmD n=1 Tax=Halalkalibaculum roseum TaxID=2709311 RepID=A0A6M1SX80_9BACT|nr:16S rRNA (guanine(966)-N(2))-methyltransferase RsmD [Halalkalibaculum roseum]NGP77592.1 16S rRNA (guanine(966)-N(2))-methyltransferase RsmD [Halalkalibaculum roseum]
MRIITGTLKGRRINIPKNLDVRPTTDRTKEGLFSTIESWKYIRDSRVLDLFAGSGSLGIEAISRGAAEVLFVDQEPRNISHIEKLAQEFEVGDRIRTVTMDVKQFLQGPAVPYDFIFADPPYTYGELNEIVDSIFQNSWLKESGWLILEHNTHYDFREHKFSLMEKEYGKTLISILSPQASKNDQS